MTFKVQLTRPAQRDIELIRDFIAESDGQAAANHVLGSLLAVVDGLEEFPDRGTRPSELEALGRGDIRQLFFKPYRLVYRVTGDLVSVLLIADGRRDLRTLLQRRVIRS